MSGLGLGLGLGLFTGSAVCSSFIAATYWPVKVRVKVRLKGGG